MKPCIHIWIPGWIQSANTRPILPQYRPIHLAVVCLYKEQDLYWDPPLVSTEDDLADTTIQVSTLPIWQSTTNPAPIPPNTSGLSVLTQGTRTLLGLTIGLDGGRFQIHFNSYPTPIQYHHWKISLHSTIWYILAIHWHSSCQPTTIQIDKCVSTTKSNRHSHKHWF